MFLCFYAAFYKFLVSLVCIELLLHKLYFNEHCLLGAVWCSNTLLRVINAL